MFYVFHRSKIQNISYRWYAVRKKLFGGVFRYCRFRLRCGNQNALADSAILVSVGLICRYTVVSEAFVADADLLFAEVVA